MDSNPVVWELRDAYDRSVVPVGADVVDFGHDGRAFEIEELQSMVGTVHSVGTTAVESESLSDDYGAEYARTNPRWAVVAVDPDSMMVTLERQAFMPEYSDDMTADGLGPTETLGEMLGGTGDSMGPERIQVDYTTIFDDTENEHNETVRVLPADEHDALGDALTALDNDYIAFERDYGATPSDAVSYIEMGDYSQFSGELNPNASPALVVNDSYGSTGVQIVTQASDVPMGLRNLWANTAADEHRWALALHMAVAEEFDLDTVPMETLIGRSSSATSEAKETYDQYDVALKVYARSVYNATQEFLDGYDGIEGALPVVRGMALSSAVYNEHYSGVPTDKGRWDRTGPEPKAIWTPVEVTLNPLSSFSASATIARRFSTRGSGAHQSLTRAWVPREQIWGISTLGNGSYGEAEVIVLGGDDSLEAEMRIN